MKRRLVTVATAFTLTLSAAFVMWRFAPWKTVSQQLSTVSQSSLPPFWYYSIILIVAVTIMAMIGWALKVIPKRQALALRKPESPIVIGEHKISVESFTHTPQSSIKPSELFTIENEARKTLSQIIGGFVVIIGLLFTGANLAITQQETEKNRSLALEGQITDRFTKAIAQLGDSKLEVRLGGIYALERIAKDSEKDHWTIMEVLTAYVREHTPYRQINPKSPFIPSKKFIEKMEDTKPSTDIQAILTVIGRRNSQRKEQPIDLTNTLLSGANLSRANLSGACLCGTNLSGANLSGASLYETDFSGANLHNANFGAVTLDTHALLVTSIIDANLSNVDLSGANLRLTYLNGTNLRNADLTGADLSGAKLRNVDLVGANLRNANLIDVDLKGADLHGASFSKALNLTWEQIAEARIDEKTALPPEITEKHNDEIKALIEKTKYMPFINVGVICRQHH
jgi:Pentapeptide repeats (8 copies)